MKDIRRALDELKNPQAWHQALSAEHCDRDSLSGYLLQRLQGERREVVHAHVAGCNQCTVTIDMLRGRVNAHIGDALAVLLGLLDGDGRGWTAGRWTATHAIARALRDIHDEGVSLSERDHIMRSILLALEAFGSARAHDDLDDIWPFLEALEEGAIDVYGEPEFSSELADHYALMSERSSSAILRCGLAYGIGELFERGDRSRDHAGLIAERLMAGPHPEAPVVLALLNKIRPEIGERVSGESRERLRAAEAEHRYLVPQVMKHAEDAAAAMSLGGTSSDRSLPSAFGALLEMIHQREPLPGIAGLIGIRKALKTIISRDLVDDTRVGPNPFVKTICDAMFTPAIQRPECPAFLPTEASEVLRDKLSDPLARAMGDMLPIAPERVCQACFICIAEGLEERFNGDWQSEVPQFLEVALGKWKFIEVSQDEVQKQLGLFGHAAAREAINNPALGSMFEWFNVRMTNWLEPDQL